MAQERALLQQGLFHEDKCLMGKGPKDCTSTLAWVEGADFADQQHLAGPSTISDSSFVAVSDPNTFSRPFLPVQLYTDYMHVEVTCGNL